VGVGLVCVVVVCCCVLGVGGVCVFGAER